MYSKVHQQWNWTRYFFLLMCKLFCCFIKGYNHFWHDKSSTNRSCTEMFITVIKCTIKPEMLTCIQILWILRVQLIREIFMHSSSFFSFYIVYAWKIQIWENSCHRNILFFFKMRHLNVKTFLIYSIFKNCSNLFQLQSPICALQYMFYSTTDYMLLNEPTLSCSKLGLYTRD